MKKNLLTIIFILIVGICHAQNIKYFKDQDCQVEVIASKAKFIQQVNENADGSFTTTVSITKSGEVVKSESFRESEPVGVWRFKKGNRVIEKDFSFKLIYSDSHCANTLNDVKDVMQDDPSIHYASPKIDNDGTSIYSYIIKYLEFPVRARENGIQGVVYLGFTVTTEGEVENVNIAKGVNPELDKEAARVIRNLKFSSPAFLDGVKKSICLVIPISFKLM